MRDSWSPKRPAPAPTWDNVAVAASSKRTLVLLRHAKSAWPDLPDHERPLAPRGRRAAPVMGRWLRQAACVPDYVLCSTARRARQTWQLAEGALRKKPPVIFEHGIYGASAAGLLDLVRHAPSAARTVVVVGHEPLFRIWHSPWQRPPRTQTAAAWLVRSRLTLAIPQRAAAALTSSNSSSVSENCTTFGRDSACLDRRRLAAFAVFATLTTAIPLPRSLGSGPAPGPNRRRLLAAPLPSLSRTALRPEINNGYEYLAPLQRCVFNCIG